MHGISKNDKYVHKLYFLACAHMCIRICMPTYLLPSEEKYNQHNCCTMAHNGNWKKEPNQDCNKK